MRRVTLDWIPEWRKAIVGKISEIQIKCVVSSIAVYEYWCLGFDKCTTVTLRCYIHPWAEWGAYRNSLYYLGSCKSKVNQNEKFDRKQTLGVGRRSLESNKQKRQLRVIPGFLNYGERSLSSFRCTNSPLQRRDIALTMWNKQTNNSHRAPQRAARPRTLWQ